MTGVYWVKLPFGARLFVQVNTDGAERALKNKEDKMKNLRPVFQQFANIMRRSFAENFRMGGRPHKWTPLKPSTIAQKSLVGAELGFPYATARGRRRIRRLEQMRGGRLRRSLSNILIARGDLRDSYAQKGRDHIERVRVDELEIGSAHWLAPIHEYGTKPYTIRPRRARALRFFTMGGYRFAQMVRHPGLPARPVVIAQDEDLEAMAQEVVKHLES